MAETLEDRLRAHDLRSADGPLLPAPIGRLLEGEELVPLSAGLQSRVFRMRGKPWVVKEGRWDLEIGLFEGVTLPLYADMTERVLSAFSFTFLPTERQIRRLIAQYAVCDAYYGDPADDERRARRDGLADRARAIAAEYGLAETEGLRRILESPVRLRGFLPRESLLVGDSFSPQNKGRPTVFIFQEFVDGRPLHDCDPRHLPHERREELVTWLFLTLVLHADSGLLPDTRPRYPLAQSYDWFGKTDNIFVTRDGVRFIDTRWFWETEENIVRRGAIIPDLTLRALTATLDSLLRTLA